MENLTVENKVFKDKELNKSMLFVINDIVEEFDKLIPAGPQLGFKKIQIVNDCLYGPTLYWPLNKKYYKIGLNVAAIYHNQIAFQFTQEYSKLYCDPRINNWFIEIIAHISALYALDFLSKKWKEDYPTENLKDYYEKFSEYKNNLVGAAFNKIDIVKYQVSSTWIENQVAKLRTNDKINRGKVLIIAFELLPIFRDNKEYWKLLPYFGKYSIPTPASDTANLNTNRNAVPDFENLVKNVPENLKPLLIKLLD
ncbi:MAG: hypothetical protein PF487_08225, partial [Bacteroidales bacterium]|nr:hypothetical protein [Bacteroidales bacterium]